MELEDLKDIWRNGADGPKTEQSYSAEELAQMMHAQAKDPISRIRRAARLEYFATIAFIPFTIAAALLYQKPEIRFSAIVLALFCGVFVLYYRKQLKALDSFGALTENVREAVAGLYSNFRRYVKAYRLVYRLLIPLFFTAGAILGGNLLSGDLHRLLTSPIAVIIIVVALTLSVFICDRALAWYIEKLYGRHFARLRQIMESFEQE